jgi:PAS domain S-box-containing protein
MAEQLRIARRAAENSERETKVAHQQITGILESVSDGFQALDSDFRFVYVNSTAERLLGESRAALQGKRLFDRFPELFGRDLESQFRAAALNGGMAQFEHYFEPWQRWFELNVYPSTTGGFSVYFSDITERKNAGRQREKPIFELEDRLAQVKVLSGLLPICASCKKIRDAHGTWRQIEVYIQEHSSVEFTHSVCPHCIERLYPEFTQPS